MVETVAAVNREPTDKEIRLVIAASSAPVRSSNGTTSSFTARLPH